jgi:hypothetical protein
MALAQRGPTRVGDGRYWLEPVTPQLVETARCSDGCGDESGVVRAHAHPDPVVADGDTQG